MWHEWLVKLIAPWVVPASLFVGMPQAPIDLEKPSDEITRLELMFSASGGEMNLKGQEAQQKDDRPSPIYPGQILELNDIMALAKSAQTEEADEALFSGAIVNVEIISDDGAFHLVQPLASCKKLDLFSDLMETFAERADCDGQTYAYSVNDRRISVSADGREVFSHTLGAGLYVLNGMPILMIRGRDE